MSSFVCARRQQAVIDDSAGQIQLHRKLCTPFDPDGLQVARDRCMVFLLETRECQRLLHLLADCHFPRGVPFRDSPIAVCNCTKLYPLRTSRDSYISRQNKFRLIRLFRYLRRYPAIARFFPITPLANKTIEPGTKLTVSLQEPSGM